MEAPVRAAPVRNGILAFADSDAGANWMRAALLVVAAVAWLRPDLPGAGERLLRVFYALARNLVLPLIIAGFVPFGRMIVQGIAMLLGFALALADEVLFSLPRRVLRERLGAGILVSFAAAVALEAAAVVGAWRLIVPTLRSPPQVVARARVARRFRVARRRPRLRVALDRTVSDSR